MKIPNNKEIAVFSDLKNPKAKNLSTKDVKGALENIIKEDYEPFSPNNIPNEYICEFADIYGGSLYSTREKFTKWILASAMYSNDKLIRYFDKTADEQKQKAVEQNIMYNSRKYKFLKKVRLISDRARKKIGLSGIYIKNYFDGSDERRRVAKLKILSKVYKEMSEVVAEIGNEFSGKSIEDIIRLVELNHIFCGFYNKTDVNITFTDERIRDYGIRIQQFVERIWGSVNGKDEPNPIPKEELFPLKPKT